MGKVDVKKNAVKIIWWGVFLFCLLVVEIYLKSLIVRVFNNYDFLFGLSMSKSVMYGLYFILLPILFLQLKKSFSQKFIYDFYAYLLIILGAIFNLGERLCFGFVRDWIYITVGPWTGVYNLADGYILFGISLLVIGNMKSLKNKF